MASAYPHLSETQLEGLAAVARGEVIRTHTGSLYTITGPVGSKALWFLFRARLIADGKKTRGSAQFAMTLTTTGEAVLAAYLSKAESKADASGASSEMRNVPIRRLYT